MQNPSSAGIWGSNSGLWPVRIITLNLDCWQKIPALIPHPSFLCATMTLQSLFHYRVHTVISTFLSSHGTVSYWSLPLTTATPVTLFERVHRAQEYSYPTEDGSISFPFKIPAVPISFGHLASEETKKSIPSTRFINYPWPVIKYFSWLYKEKESDRHHYNYFGILLF